MNNKKNFSIIAIVAVLLTFSFSDCFSQKRPAWVDGYFNDEANSYIEAVSATGSTEDEARNKAAIEFLRRRSIATGMQTNVQIINGNFTVTGADALVVEARVLDEYREQQGTGEYRVHLLAQIAKIPGFQVERVRVTDEYPFSPRVFVPGMAQLHKGSKSKALFFIISEVALIGGIVVCESLRASYETKINATHNAKDRQNYIDAADNMQNARNICIAGAAILYAWNIIDGISAKGKKHVQILGDNNLKINPYFFPDAGGGISLTLNF